MLKRRRMSLVALIGVGLAAAVITSAAVASAPTITLEKAVHFTAPNGDDVVLGPGTFEIEAVKEGLRLSPKGGKPEDTKVVRANAMPHPETLQAPKAVAESFGEDMLRLTLLGLEGKGFEAMGSYSGIRTRGGAYNTFYGTGALYQNTTVSTNQGSQNTAVGYNALYNNATGSVNTAVGYSALQANTSGAYNTAVGWDALYSNNGASNTAMGFSALYANITGNFNTAMGAWALRNNTGSNNTAIGYYALNNNTGGYSNTAAGVYALRTNVNGGNNTAMGYQALMSNNYGGVNTAIGGQALYLNYSGEYNTAVGFNTLYSNSSGKNNTAIGVSSLQKSTGHFNTAIGASALLNIAGDISTGSYNTAVGYSAGSAVFSGSNNIYVNSSGVNGENGTVRIGTIGTQTQVFLAGAERTYPITGSNVQVSSAGQLFVPSSSLRYKDTIHDMAEASHDLYKLRPVTFKYKTEVPDAGEDRPREYGLIAEEVAEVYPDLVGRNADGEVVTVHYHKLIPMLLNELQRQDRVNQEQRQQIEALTAEVAALKSK